MVRLQNPVGLGRAKGYGMERQSDETSRESDYLSPGDEQFVFVTPRRKGGDGCQVRSQVP